MKIRPLYDRVLVKRLAHEETTKGGIIIPDTAKEKPLEGVVHAVGLGRRNKNGEFTPMPVKEGDRVLFAKYGGTEIKIDGKEYKLLNADDILAIVV
jgi:chaperonin GroES